MSLRLDVSRKSINTHAIYTKENRDNRRINMTHIPIFSPVGGYCVRRHTRSNQFQILDPGTFKEQELIRHLRGTFNLVLARRDDRPVARSQDVLRPIETYPSYVCVCTFLLDKVRTFEFNLVSSVWKTFARAKCRAGFGF